MRSETNLYPEKNPLYRYGVIRIKRISDETTYSYIYAWDKLMRKTVGNDTLDVIYDTNGLPLTMT